MHPALFRRARETVEDVESEGDAVWMAAGCPGPESLLPTPDLLPRPKPHPAAEPVAQGGEWMEPRRLAGTLLTQLEGIDMPVYIKALERALIDRAIDRCNGSVSGAARVLRTNRTTIIAKIKRSA